MSNMIHNPYRNTYLTKKYKKPTMQDVVSWYGGRDDKAFQETNSSERSSSVPTKDVPEVT